MSNFPVLESHHNVFTDQNDFDRNLGHLFNPMNQSAQPTALKRVYRTFEMTFFFPFSNLIFWMCPYTWQSFRFRGEKKYSKMFLKINWSVKNGVTLCDIGLVCDLLTPGYGLLNKQSAHTLLLNMHGWTLIDSKGYVKIMLKKKLNPIVPKNRKFVISLQNWKKEGKQKNLKNVNIEKTLKISQFFSWFFTSF